MTVIPLKPLRPVIEHRRFSEIEAVPISWLWPGMLARGKVTLLAGDPGLGKSQATASIAGIISSGGYWPAAGLRAEAGTVAFLSAEDDPSDTMRPRLEAAGADLDRVIFVEPYARSGQVTEVFDIDRHLGDLVAIAAEYGGIDLLVVDPVTAFVGAKDGNANTDMRSIMAKLADFATSQNCAVLAVTHFNKGKDQKAIGRVIGSTAFTAAARVVLAVVRDNSESSRRLVVPIKNNVAIDRTGFAFTVEAVELSNGIQTSRVAWSDETFEMSADDAMEGGNEETKKTSRLQEACRFLEDILAKGPVAASAVEQAAATHGIAIATLRRAADEVGVIKQKTRNLWLWRLPDDDGGQDAQDAHRNGGEPDDHLDHLGYAPSAKVVELD